MKAFALEQQNGMSVNARELRATLSRIAEAITSGGRVEIAATSSGIMVTHNGRSLSVRRLRAGKRRFAIRRLLRRAKSSESANFYRWARTLRRLVADFRRLVRPLEPRRHPIFHAAQ